MTVVESRRPRKNYWLSAVAVILSVVVFLVPFAFIVLTALKSQQQASLLDFSWPSEFQFVANFVEVVQARDYMLIIAFINSTILTVASVSIMVVLSAMVAFVLQRRKNRWTPLINFLVLSGLIIRRPSSRRSGCCRSWGSSGPFPG